MNNVDIIIQQAEQHCKAHGARLTAKRKQILAGLVQADKALSAYELVDFFKEHYGKNISAVSVYRILEFLKNERLVHRLNSANKYVACAHIRCNDAQSVPQFLICGKCSKVKEISIKPSTIAELQTNAQAAGFKMISPQLEMNGLCDDCIVQTPKKNAGAGIQ